MSQSTKSFATQLIQHIGQFHKVAIAFSGGVDSTVVCQAAVLSDARKVVAITGDSPSVPLGEVENCRKLADEMGCSHLVIPTREGDDENYIQNSGDRCFWCKSELYQQIAAWVNTQIRMDVNQKSSAQWTILNGTNVDDLGDYRPGLKSADQHGVVSPLVECGINKQNVRALAKHWQLPVWNKPAGPCLASRIAPGESVTPEKLQMIDAAERFIRERGFEIVRVRFHTGKIARIEVSRDRLPALFELHDAINDKLRNIGFKFVSVDLGGFRSGNLNSLIQLKSNT